MTALDEMDATIERLRREIKERQESLDFWLRARRAEGQFLNDVARAEREIDATDSKKETAIERLDAGANPSAELREAAQRVLNLWDNDYIKASRDGGTRARHVVELLRKALQEGA